MADRELVIKISEEDYNFVKKQVADGITNPLKIWIANGTPLPKGHGRLGDLDALREEVYSWGMNDYDPSDFVDAIDDAKTIIEADRSDT